MKKSRTKNKAFPGASGVACLFVFVFLCASLSALAQPFFKNWTTDDGLPHSNVINIAQTPDGYLWVATVEGLARFDGVRFKVFNKSNTPEMPSNRLYGMFTDTAGRLWVNYQNDQTVVVYENGKFKSFVKGVDFECDENYPPEVMIGQTRNRNWRRAPEMRFRAGGDEYVYEDGRFVRRPFQDRGFPARVFAADLESVWIDEGDALYRVVDDRLERYSKTEPLPFDLRHAFPLDSDEHDGTLWFSGITTEKKLNRLMSFRDGNLKVFPQIAGIQDLEFDRHGNLWIASFYEGIVKVNAATIARNDPQNFKIIPNTRGGWMLFRDRDANLWYAGGGLNLIISEQPVTLYSRNTASSIDDSSGNLLPEDNFYPIVEDREGTIWLGAWQDRLYSYRDGKFASEYFFLPTALFVDSRGRLWRGGGPQKIEYRENGGWTALDYKKTIPNLPDREITIGELSFITEDRDGAIWFGTEIGAVRYAPAGSRVFSTADGLPSNTVTSYLITRSGDLWIGTTGGVAVKEGERFRAFTEKDGLAANFTRSFYEDADGAIWIGSYDGGLTRYKDGVFKKITKRDGLFSDGVFVILEDDAGWLWMNSNHGIYRVRRQELNDFADGRVGSVTSVSYGPEDGLLETEGNGGKQPAGLRASDGRLWFPMAKGVAVIDPQSVKRESQPPPVLIEELRIDQKTTEVRDGEIVLRPAQVALEIDYTALGFIGAERMRFRYRLEGLEEAWNDAGTRRTAYYSHIPDGEYTFRVSAASPEGVWNETGAVVKIVVVPPFYKRNWFYALAVLVVFGLITLIYFQRVRRIQRLSESRAEFARRLIESQESERKRIALELHDSIGQVLAVIRNRTLIGLDAPEPEKMRRQLQEISEASNVALAETREIARNLHPAQVENLGLTTALRSLVESIESATGLHCETAIGEVPEDLPYEAAINIYRISQECLSNIIKHSNASRARFELRVENETLLLTIEDDGRGFTPTADSSGLGLTGMRERAQLLGAQLTIHSQPGEGTQVRLVLNLS